MDVQGPLYKDNSNKMQQLQGTIILETNFIHIYVLKYIFLSSNIWSISLYIIPWKIRNLNKSKFWLQLSLLIKPWKKSRENSSKNMGKICAQFHKSRKFCCSVKEGLKRKGKQWNLSSFTPSLRNKHKITNRKFRQTCPNHIISVTQQVSACFLNEKPE